jgi:hypothetical protein
MTRNGLKTNKLRRLQTSGKTVNCIIFFLVACCRPERGGHGGDLLLLVREREGASAGACPAGRWRYQAARGPQRGRTWPARLAQCGQAGAPVLRLPALMDLYIHPLYVLVSKILSSILNSSAPIHPLYHLLSTLSMVGPTCHFI